MKNDKKLIKMNEKILVNKFGKITERNNKLLILDNYILIKNQILK